MSSPSPSSNGAPAPGSYGVPDLLIKAVSKDPALSAVIVVVWLAVGAVAVISGADGSVKAVAVVVIALGALTSLALLGRRPAPQEGGGSGGTSVRDVTVAGDGGVGIIVAGEGNTVNVGPARSADEDRAKIREAFSASPPIAGNATRNLHDQLGFDESDRREVREVLAAAAKQVSAELGVPLEDVRANLFGMCEDSMLRMITDFTYNMNRPEEWGIEMPLGYGSTGKCFERAQASVLPRENVATSDDHWAENPLKPSELAKAHPELRWILSYPVFAPGSPGRCVWILNIDGLREVPTVEKLRQASPFLHHWSGLLTQKMGLVVRRENP